MTDVTIKQLADQIGSEVSYERLITQLKKAGVNVNNSSDIIKEEEKIKLLHMLKQEQYDFSEKNKHISFKRTTASSMKIKTPSGKGMIVNITYKKDHIYIKKHNSLHDNFIKIVDNKITSLDKNENNIICKNDIND
ncbi:MAG: hypothetical protein Q8O27_01215, partial [Enterobacteriaceae bacterium]|nr:hypothetical protein [Enterobacteriaceae bacterium]